VLIDVTGKSEYDTNLEQAAIKVGGTDETTAGKFVPNINASKWDDECWLNINHPDVVTAEKEVEVDGVVSLSVGDNTHRYYVNDDGRLEYEIIFSKRPSSDVVTLDLDFPDGLSFWFQPPLTQDPVNVGAVRPDNVVNSYAAYWKEENNKYTTGKFCHIYRPKLIDANKQEAWAKLDITDKVMSITLDKVWMDNAAYPVVLDPEIGYSTKGASQYGNNTIIRGNVTTTDGTGGDTTTFHCMVEGIGANPGMKAAIYETAGGSPQNQDLVEQVEWDVAVSDDENTPAAGSTLAANTSYLLAYIPEETQTKIFFDAAGGAAGWFQTGRTYGDEFADPSTIEDDDTAKFSLWCEYAAGSSAKPWWHFQANHRRRVC
jgi:hypothetical protein